MLRRHIQHVGYFGLTAGGCNSLLRYVKRLSIDLAVHLILIQETEGRRAHIARVKDRFIGVQPGSREISTIGKNIASESSGVSRSGGKQESK